jgi:mannose-6-phosphate isomerase-like protein (cupin superfamily)
VAHWAAKTRPCPTALDEAMSNAGEPSRHLWFLDTEVTIRVSHVDGSDGISVLEHRAPYGNSAPLHIHRNEDEIFHILEGKMLFRVADRDVHAGTGDTLLAPKRTPHTYRVDSADGARWLTIMRGGDFEGFVRSCGRPAERSGVPDPSGPPTPERVAALAAECIRHGIELIGPPLH